MEQPLPHSWHPSGKGRSLLLLLVVLFLGFGSTEEEMPPPPQALAAKTPTSFSVIVPAYNTGPYVARTLKSVETSIDFFFRLTGTLWKEVKAEVVVVDDASSDNTLSMVLGFVHRRKPQQRAHNVTWKVLSLPQQVFAGAARNLGVLHSEGEVLFFLDSDDLYHTDHIARCFSSLAALWNTHVIVETNVTIELEGTIPEERLDRILTSIPQNKCLYRNYHDFVEGFPEQLVYRKYNDVGYVKALSALDARKRRHSTSTVTYKLYPGNSLDRHRDRFTAPFGTVLPHEDLTSVDGKLRDSLASTHAKHLVKKSRAVIQGGSGEENPFWAIHSYQYKQARKTCQCEYHGRSIAEVNQQRIMEYAEQQRTIGEHQPKEWALEIFFATPTDTRAALKQQFNGFSFCPDLFLFSS